MPARKKPRPPQRPPRAASLTDAMPVAMQLHQAGQLDTARTLYESILKVAPGHANAAHFLGVVHHQLGHSDEAVIHIRRSIEIDPTVPGWYNNLGNVLLESKRLAEAADAYEKAAEMSPQDATLLNN